MIRLVFYKHSWSKVRNQTRGGETSQVAVSEVQVRTDVGLNQGRGDGEGEQTLERVEEQNYQDLTWEVRGDQVAMSFLVCVTR